MQSTVTEHAAVAAAAPAPVCGAYLMTVELELAGEDRGDYALFDVYGREGRDGYDVTDVAAVSQAISARHLVRASLGEIELLCDLVAARQGGKEWHEQLW